jgi:hypothetical protein
MPFGSRSGEPRRAATGEAIRAPVGLTNTFSLFSVAPPSAEWKSAPTTCPPLRTTWPAVAAITASITGVSASTPRYTCERVSS